MINRTGDRLTGKRHCLFGLTICLILFYFIVSPRAYAIENVNNLSFDLYSQEHGLSNNQINSVLQDKKGWLWIGTSQGVCRFDGYRFTVFKNDPDDSTSLKGSLVRVVFEDHKGQVWVGTENGGLNKFDRGRETFEHIAYYGDSALLRNVSVTSIQEDKFGCLWVGTEGSLYKIDEKGKLNRIHPSNLRSFNEYFRIIHPDQSGRIWLGTNSGVYIYNRETNTAEEVNIEGSLANEEIWEIFPESDGKIWIGTYSSGMFTVDPRRIETRMN